jgi:hypothetical protein
LNVSIVNILICQYFGRDEKRTETPIHPCHESTTLFKLSISFFFVAGFAWQIAVHYSIASLRGRSGLQILNICPCLWTGNPPREVDWIYEQHYRKKDGRG